MVILLGNLVTAAVFDTRVCVAIDFTPKVGAQGANLNMLTRKFEHAAV